MIIWKCTKSHYNKFSTEEFIMIYTPKITSDIQINSLRDLVKLNPFLEDSTLKINKSQIARAGKRSTDG